MYNIECFECACLNMSVFSDAHTCDHGKQEWFMCFSF